MLFSVAYWQQEMQYGIEPEFGDMTAQGEVRYAKRNTSDEDFDYSALNWAIDGGIIDKKDIAIFNRTVSNEIYRGAEHLSANGEYIVDTGKCLMFTNGDFHRPTLTRVIVFDTEYESLLYEAKRRILDDARNTGNVQAAKRAIENIYGPTFAVEFTKPVYGANARKNRGGKRGNSSRVNKKTQSLKERLAAEGLEQLLEDTGSFADIAYMKAVKRGDMVTAQEMVNEAAKLYGYTEEVFHGMGNRHNVYQSGHGQYGDGVYFTYDQPTARGYGKVVDHLFVKSGKIANYDDAYKALGKTDDQTLDEFANTLGFPSFDEMIDDWDNDPTDVASNPALIDMLMSRGFEGFIDDGNSGFVLWDRDGIEYRIKSADPVTYDDDGNVIPLSKRFDSTNNDIRYSDRDYSYDALSKKPDMVVTTVGGNIPKNRADIVAKAKKNAASVGRLDPKTGSISVHVKDIGRDVGIGRDGLKHSIDRRIDVNAPVLLKAGEIISNSIRINELTPKKERIDESYVLIGAARNADNELYIVRSVVNRFSHNLVSMDVLYAINAKKEPAALLPLSTEKPALGTDSKISIAELLDYVNRYFPDILPEEVLKHYGHDFRPEGELGEAALYSDRSTESVSNRSLLADALESTTQHDVERKKLQEYKSKMPNKDVAEIQSLIKHEVKTTDNYLGIDAKWLYNKQKGHEYFALYSTANEKDPTILYASKGLSAEVEHDAFMLLLNRKEQVYELLNTGSGMADRLLGSVGDVLGGTGVYNSFSVGTGSNKGNGSIYSGHKRKRPSAAFENCIKNIDEVQSRYGVDDHYQFAVDRGDLKTATASLIVIVGIKKVFFKENAFPPYDASHSDSHEVAERWAKRRIIDEAEATGKVHQSLQIIAAVFGQEFVRRHVPANGFAYAKQDGRRKGSNGSRINQTARSLKDQLGEYGLDHLLEDIGSFLDIAYMNALNRGDMETVQQMVDAMKYGYQIVQKLSAEEYGREAKFYGTITRHQSVSDIARRNVARYRGRNRNEGAGYRADSYQSEYGGENLSVFGVDTEQSGRGKAGSNQVGDNRSSGTDRGRTGREPLEWTPQEIYDKITLIVTLVFAILALCGTISSDNVMIIISMVVSFYFGTQHEKKE